MIIGDKRYISKCCMAEVGKPEGFDSRSPIYLCKKCEEPCDLVESAAPRDDKQGSYRLEDTQDDY